MHLWKNWLKLVLQLRAAFSRLRTFQWFIIVLAAFSVRDDLLGVSSFVRALWILPCNYKRLLDFFNSSAISLVNLKCLWTQCVLKNFPLIRLNKRILLVADGLKIPKSGKRMPAVKLLHQQSDNNNKPEFINGHSCQSVGILGGFKEKTVFSVPLTADIHEGFIENSSDNKTLLDKMNNMIQSLNIEENAYLIVDAYYNSKNFFVQRPKNIDIITRVRNNGIAYEKIKSQTSKKRGRPKVYGKKLKLNDFFNNPNLFKTIDSPLPNEKNIKLQVYSNNFLIRVNGGILCKFLLVIHPEKGCIILCSTDLNISDVDLILAYAFRFKIEVSYKQAIHSLGVFSYHFWSKNFKTSTSKEPVDISKLNEQSKISYIKKINAFRIFIQSGLIAQGLLQYLSCMQPLDIWNFFSSWIKTKKDNSLPSEWVSRIALKNAFLEYLADTSENSILKKFFFEISSLKIKDLVRMLIS